MNDYSERLIESVANRLAEAADFMRELGVEVLAVRLDRGPPEPELLVVQAKRTDERDASELRFPIGKDFRVRNGLHQEWMDVDAAASVVFANVLELGA